MGYGWPSGVTPLSGTIRAREAPEYRMTFPLGDHTGLADTESTSRTGSPPFTGTLNTCTAGPSLAATAIHLPSGDHDGAPRTSSDSPTGRASAPVADRQYSVERSGRRTEAQSLSLIHISEPTR